jgi:hypothetical protein
MKLAVGVRLPLLVALALVGKCAVSRKRALVEKWLLVWKIDVGITVSTNHVVSLSGTDADGFGNSLKCQDMIIVAVIGCL